MKNASPATLNILASGKYLRADLYQFTLVTGQTYYFTSAEVPITAAVYPSVTQNTYLSGLTINRAQTTQECGLDSQELELTIAPKWDNPGGAATLAGFSVQQAARLGLLDDATCLYSKLFMNFPSANQQLDTSGGAVGWFLGAVSDIQITRMALDVKISSNLLVLNQTQMPRNLYQATCVHTLYDIGCALLQSSFTVNGIVTGSGGVANFNTNLTQADDYFDLGVITFTTGLNTGYSATVKLYQNASGTVQTMIPFPQPVSGGDHFQIYPGCDKLQSTCTTKFSNLEHFKATPYVPVPETLYDGGSSDPPAAPPPPAVQKPGLVGSNIGGGIVPGTLLSQNGSITVATSKTVFTTNVLQPNGTFNGGTIRFLTGPNIGVTANVLTSTSAGVITLTAALLATPSIGNTFTITA